jgi:BMFP domain-containing protein YqiC
MANSGMQGDLSEARHGGSAAVKSRSIGAEGVARTCGGAEPLPLFRLASTRRPEKAMTQTNSRFFDEIGRLMNDAAGVATGVRREFDTLFRTQAERVLRDLDVVRRDEFEAVKEMAQLAREENELLKARISVLEATLRRDAAGPSAIV